MSVCLFVCLFDCMLVALSVCLVIVLLCRRVWMCLSVSLPLCLPLFFCLSKPTNVCLLIRLCVPLCVCICLCVYVLCVCQCVCVCVCPCVCLSVFMSVCLSVFLWPLDYLLQVMCQPRRCFLGDVVGRRLVPGDQSASVRPRGTYDGWKGTAGRTSCWSHASALWHVQHLLSDAMSSSAFRRLFKDTEIRVVSWLSISS